MDLYTLYQLACHEASQSLDPEVKALSTTAIYDAVLRALTAKPLDRYEYGAIEDPTFEAVLRSQA